MIMANLTKAEANRVAQQMADSVYAEKKKALRDRRILILETALRRNIPEKVLRAFNDADINPYVCATSFVNYTCENGLHEDYAGYSLPNSFPVQGNKTLYATTTVEEYEELIAIKKQIGELADSQTMLERKIEGTILSLKSVKRLKEEFPEAYELLQEHIKNPEKRDTLALPISEIRELLAGKKE